MNSFGSLIDLWPQSAAQNQCVMLKGVQVIELMLDSMVFHVEQVIKAWEYCVTNWTLSWHFISHQQRIRIYFKLLLTRSSIEILILWMILCSERQTTAFTLMTIICLDTVWHSFIMTRTCRSRSASLLWTVHLHHNSQSTFDWTRRESPIFIPVLKINFLLDCLLNPFAKCQDKCWICKCAFVVTVERIHSTSE